MGKPLRAAGIYLDVTARKEAEEKNQGMRQWLAEILESISDGFIALENDFTITYFNSRSECVFGLKANEVIGKTLYTAFPGFAGSSVEAQMLDAIGNRQTALIETPSSGQPDADWLEARIYPTQNGICVYFKVITQQKQAIEALRESEERFRNLFERASDALFLHDFEGKIVDANQQACDSLGYSRNELLQLDIGSIESEYNLRKMTYKWEEMDRVSASIIGKHRRKDTTEFPVEILISLFEFRDCRLILLMARDITERAKAEEKKRDPAGSASPSPEDGMRWPACRRNCP